MLATAVRPGLLGGAVLPRRPCTRPCRAELHQIAFGRRYQGLFGHVGTVTLPLLRQRLCHTTDFEPVSDRDDFGAVAETISGGVVSLTKQTAHKQPNQVIVEARNDEVCAIALSAAYTFQGIYFMRPINLFVEL